jgi:predicted DNA-binding WGR domain protein
MIVIRRRNPARNEARYHAIGVQAMLDARWSVVHEWGRIGCSGAVRAEPFPSETQAQAAAETYLTRKRRKGYA